MPTEPEPANDDIPMGQTVAQQVLEAFYNSLGSKPDFKDIAERLRGAGNSEKAVRQALFGEAGDD